MPLAVVPTRCSSFRLLGMACQKGTFVGSDCMHNRLCDAIGVTRGRYSRYRNSNLSVMLPQAIRPPEGHNTRMRVRRAAQAQARHGDAQAAPGVDTRGRADAHGRPGTLTLHGGVPGGMEIPCIQPAVCQAPRTISTPTVGNESCAVLELMLKGDTYGRVWRLRRP
jgi:hypothetical protein